MQRRKHRQNRRDRKNDASKNVAPAVEVPAPSKRRKWLFRLLALTVVPVSLLAVLELGLRVGGYGYPTSFFLKTRIGGRSVYVENQEFGYRFFPRALARSPSPLVMDAAKGSNTFRIFLLGESAALGDPDPAYGCGRYLEVLLNERYPGTRFEVVCVAMTAINSHVILPIARECARRDGDLWVVYAGNNEMVGPFGAATIFGPKTPRLSFIRASLAAKTPRVGQLIESFVGSLAQDSSAPQSWRGMGMFLGHQTRHNDAAKERVYQYFRDNLAEIVRIGRKAGVRIILSTVASNLKDSPPFASLHSANLSGTRKDEWEHLYQEGHALELSGKFAEAVDKYSRANQLDQEYAELQFRLGSCYFTITNHAQARSRFELARDFDALPFRADSRINEIIEQVTREYSSQGVHGADAVRTLSPENSAGIPGAESFYEHVHLNFDGNYRLARALAEQVSALLPPKSNREWASPEACARRLALTDWNRYRAYETVLQGVAQAPFTNQSNSAERQRALRDEMARLKTGMDAPGFQRARELYTEALARDPDDFFLHRKFAEVLELAGDLTGSSAEWQRVRELLPHHPIAHFQLGRLFATQNKDSDALECLARALRLRPDFVEALDEEGRILAKQKRFEESIKRFDHALRLRPNDATLHFHLADALAAQGKRGEALFSLREAIRLRPGFWEARYLVGVELALQDKLEESKQQFAEVVRLQPGYALGHINLGVAFAKQGHIDEALAQFQEALKLDPQNKIARQHVRTIESLKAGRN